MTDFLNGGVRGFRLCLGRGGRRTRGRLLGLSKCNDGRIKSTYTVAIEEEDLGAYQSGGVKE